MKNLFNNISQEDKNRILEMHSGRKNTISEEKVKPKLVPYGSKPDRIPFDTPLWKTLENEIRKATNINIISKVNDRVLQVASSNVSLVLARKIPAKQTCQVSARLFSTQARAQTHSHLLV